MTCKNTNNTATDLVIEHETHYEDNLEAGYVTVSLVEYTRLVDRLELLENGLKEGTPQVKHSVLAHSTNPQFVYLKKKYANHWRSKSGC